MIIHDKKKDCIYLRREQMNRVHFHVALSRSMFLYSALENAVFENEQANMNAILY